MKLGPFPFELFGEIGFEELFGIPLALRATTPILDRRNRVNIPTGS